MIVRGENGARHNVYGLFSQEPIPRASQWGANLTSSGERIDFAGAMGIPAFMRGVSLISETAAGLPFKLYRGYGDAKKPQPNARQLALFRRPNPDTPSPFAVWSYAYVSMIRGNAYLWKLKVNGKVVGLYPVNPAFVTPKYEGASPLFELRDREYGPVIDTVGKDKIIHIPGKLLEDPYVGVSVVAAERDALGTEVARQKFDGRYLANDATPGVVLKHPGAPILEQRREIRSSFESRHVGNAGRLGMLWGGWELDSTPLSMADAQFIEAKRYGVQDIGRMLGIPASLLNDPDYTGRDTPESENTRFLQHGVGPWMTRLEQGLASDTDLFPEPDWCIELDESGFLRADIQPRWDAYRLGRQGGWVTANEIRAKEGLPPIEGGDELQETPVGGAANSGTSGSAPAEPPEPADSGD